MATRKRPPGPRPRPPSLPPQQAIRLLQERIQKAKDLLASRPLRDSALMAWANTTRDVLERSFGSDSPNVGAVLYAHGDVSQQVDMSDEEYEQSQASELEAKVRMLESCIEQLEIELKSVKGLPTMPPTTEEAQASRKVFVVHGHDHGTKETVARLLSRLELDSVILHEHPSRGKTLIEKFEEYADVGFAVVILTADDIGRAKGEQEDRARARQNVILELGFFLGKLGRKKVCALHERGVELPSDLAGIVYIPLEGEGWKLQLVQEFRAAGFSVDANRIL